jgi:hypothetical protein
MNKNAISFPRCSECGGEVRLAIGIGRRREFRQGIVLLIPDDFEIPTCSGCGEQFMIEEISGPLDRILQEYIPLSNQPDDRCECPGQYCPIHNDHVDHFPCWGGDHNKCWKSESIMIDTIETKLDQCTCLPNTDCPIHGAHK